MKQYSKLLISLVAAVVASGCAEKQVVAYQPVSWQSVPEIDQQDISCSMRVRAARYLPYDVSLWRQACVDFRRCLTAGGQNCLQQVYQPVRVISKAPSLFTGYYHPHYKGSRTKTEIYTTPILMRPANLVSAKLSDFSDAFPDETLMGQVKNNRFIPYDTRAEIAAASPSDALVWLTPEDAFFLHIQGSGTIILADGSRVNLAFAGHNGHGYTAIGGILIRRGEISQDEMSMQAIREWLQAAEPEQKYALLNENARYIFFTETDNSDVIGALGVPLVPERSLAVDWRYVPLGSLVLVETTVSRTGAPFTAVMAATDVGSAIVGAVRGDIYFGEGAHGEFLAGPQQATGKLTILAPKNAL